MVRLIVGATNPNARELLAKMFRQRYDIFVVEKGWNVKSYDDDLEFDAYDTPATLYLLQLDAKGELAGSMRMNATSRPYLLKDQFADMVQGEFPASPDTWEITRGALSPTVRKSKAYGALICASFEAALLWGAKKSIGLFSVDYIMKQMRMGLDIKPLGPPRMLGAEPHVAAEFPFNYETLERVRSSFGIAGPVIERIYYMPREDRVAA